VAIQHAGRLDELFGQRHRRNLHREPAGLPDAALDVLDTLGEMAVALREIAPRVDDADHRLAEKILARVSHLQRAGAVTEGSQVGCGEPALASKVSESLSGHFPLPEIPARAWRRFGSIMFILVLQDLRFYRRGTHAVCGP